MKTAVVIGRVGAPFFLPFFLPYKIFALFCLCSYQHRAATCLAAAKKLGGEMRPSPKPLCLSQPLHRGLASATHPGPRTAKNKNHAASPTSHSARGPGGGAWRSSGGRRKAKIYFAPCHASSHALCWAGFSYGTKFAIKKRSKIRKKLGAVF